MHNILTDELVAHKIYVFRGKKVMMDRDLARLYGVETKRLNEAVRRNMERFPEDFMFQLSKQETENLRSQFATSSWGGRRYGLLAFTEQGVAMLSSVLHSERAILVNIHIMRAFAYLREATLDMRELRLKIENLEKHYDEQFKIIFDALRQMLIDEEEKPPIGFV